MPRPAIHHATAARATKLGASIEVLPTGETQLIHLETGARSDQTYPTPKAAVEALATDGDDFLWEDLEEVQEDEGEGEGEGPTRSKSGVMPLDYHKLYTQNGGGCGDTLDTRMRAEFMRAQTAEGKEGEPVLDTAALRAWAESIGLWRTTWTGLNPGMQRMNLANVIRGALRQNAELQITLGEYTGRFGVTHQPRAKRKSRAKAK